MKKVIAIAEKNSQQTITVVDVDELLQKAGIESDSDLDSASLESKLIKKHIESLGYEFVTYIQSSSMPMLNMSVNNINKTVKHWNEEVPERQLFEMEVKDERPFFGQLYVDFAPVDGNVSDVLTVITEVDMIPETDTQTQSVKILTDFDYQALSIYKVNESFVLVADESLNISVQGNKVVFS
ncbi:MAG: hypothetical protein JHC31_14190 [Sulfurihydrogenibium sp.]|jgi:hypothetical protein|nr:hypothetical protein [Sulfurihydrogenibium sp.]